MGNVNRKILGLFKDFVRNLHDVDEPEADWKNRVSRAWPRLHAFAKELGSDFVKAIEAYWTPLDTRDIVCDHESPLTPEEVRDMPKELREIYDSAEPPPDDNE